MSRLTRLFQEMASAILYHATTYDAIAGILSSNEFHLSEEWVQNKQQYFMCAARSKNNAFRGAKPVMLVLDGNALNTKYAAKAHDAFGWRNDRQFDGSEMEDRIRSSKPIIPDACRYIKEIHVESPTIALEEKITNLARSKSIPLYVYDNVSDFLQLNKAKAKRRS